MLRVPKKLAESGYKIVSYTGNKHPVVLRCPNGHEFTTSPRRKIYGCSEFGCSEFKRTSKYDPREIRFRIENRGYRWVSGEYENVLSPLGLTCPKGHSIIMHWKSFQEGNNCKVCLNLDPITLDKVCKALSTDGYTYLRGEVKNGRSRFEILCPAGHTYTASWTQYQQGYRCPRCSGIRRYTTQDIQEMSREWGFTLKSDYNGCNGPLDWICPHGHEHTQSWKNLREYRGACPVCNFSSSQAEKEILNWVNSLGLTTIHQCRNVVDGKELDIFVPEFNLAIEHCGIYHHSEKFLARNYHLEKLEACLSKNIQLVTIFSDEWAHRKEQVQNLLLSKLGQNQIVFARKCTLKVVPTKEARTFLESNHIQGYAPCQLTWGLYHQESLLMTLSLSKHHRQNCRDWVLNRLCTISGITVVGGLRKLLKRAMQDVGIAEVITFADRRYSEGLGYLKTGFKPVEVLRPDYSYMKSNHRYSKQSLKKTRVEKLSQKTERELRFEAGYLRIWDCGKIRYKFYSSTS